MFSIWEMTSGSLIVQLMTKAALKLTWNMQGMNLFVSQLCPQLPEIPGGH